MDRSLTVKLQADLAAVGKVLADTTIAMRKLGLSNKNLSFFLSLPAVPSNWERIWVEV